MNNQVFVPITDDMIYNNPDLIEGPLVPYEAGMECHEWLSIEINPEDDTEIQKIVKARAERAKKTQIRAGSKNLSLVYNAVPRGC